jgi:hypothetical protein
MFYIVIGYLVPNLVGTILMVSLKSDSAIQIIKTILLIDPFYPFYTSLIYTVIK